MNEYARDEDGNRVGVVNFDYDYDQEEKEFKAEFERFTPQEIEAGFMFVRALLAWAWQNGNSRSNGLGVRLAVLCWVFLSDVQSMSQADVATVIGKSHRQSFNRWAVKFAKFFNFKSAQMRMNSK